MVDFACLAVSIAFAFAVRASAFAVKKDDRKSGSASTKKGFGKAPLTLEQTFASFKNRLPKSAEDCPCPCGISGKTYGECCAPYHQGSLIPLSPLAVLKSRYSAFCWRNIGYVMKTTHPTCRDFQKDKIAWAKDLDKRGMFDSFDFVGLKVLENETISAVDENIGFIEFQVQLRANSLTGSQIDGKVTTIQELSTFQKDEITGGWSYASGDVRSTVEGVQDIVLNAATID